ncbi:MAG: putative Multi-sensor signal transduction histidine kinase [Candidatus Saccharibacteria bacterium]|nr:putative Multi-sensor signal transduction histidine kinase [Candidatus Saccharibacteria bacterium]
MIDDTRTFPRVLAYCLTGLTLFLALGDLVLIRIVQDIRPPHYSLYSELFAYASGFVIIPILMYLATKYSSLKLFAVTYYNLTMGILLLTFSDINSPFTPLWSIMILFSSIYYGWKGFIGSCSILIAVAIAYVAIYYKELYPEPSIYIFLSSCVIVMTFLMSYLFVRIIMSSHKKNRDLVNAQRSELLQVNRLNTLLNSISDAVMTLNRYGRVTSQNAAAQVFFDTNESLIGYDIDKKLILKDGDNKEVSIRNLIEAVKSSSLRDDLSVGNGPDTRHLSLQIARIRSTYGDNEEYGVVLIIRDITKQKTLEDEKDEFISVTSHELRTPVAIAEGSLSNFLLMQERGVPQSKLIEAAETAHKQIIYLAQMINDLSTLSRAERGVGDDVEPINVNELMYNLFSKYTPEAEDKGLKLNLDTEHHLPEIETSRLYLEEILQNFITNAIKYTKEGSVTFGAEKESEGYIRFYVKDTGIGMSKPDMQHIFEKFYRSEDYRTRETSGTGLGLYVVEKLAAKLGTDIKVSSRLNVGSSFSFVVALKSHKLKKIEDKAAKVAQIQQVEVEPEPEETPEAVS